MVDPTRQRWLRTMDFRRPATFSTDQERRMRRLMEAFCATAAQRVAAEHRLPVELEVIDVQQLTWADAFGLLPDDSVHGTLATAPHGGRLLLSSHKPLLCTALEGLLGGDATEAQLRELTPLDLIVVRRLLGTFVEALSGLWFDQAATTLSLVEVDDVPEAVKVASASEPTLALTLEARLHRLSSIVSVLVPSSAFAPVAAAFSQPDDAAPPPDARTAADLRHRLEQVDVELRTEIAQTTLALEELSALRPGDVVRLDGRAGDPVTVFVDDTPVYASRAGRSGTRRAVQVLAPIEVPA